MLVKHLNLVKFHLQENSAELPDHRVICAMFYILRAIFTPGRASCVFVRCREFSHKSKLTHWCSALKMDGIPQIRVGMCEIVSVLFSSWLKLIRLQEKPHLCLGLEGVSHLWWHRLLQINERINQLLKHANLRFLLCEIPSACADSVPWQSGRWDHQSWTVGRWFGVTKWWSSFLRGC